MSSCVKTDFDRWKEAQDYEAEFALNTIFDGNDWNDWWCKQFDEYKAIAGLKLPNVLEVGAGPHTNIRYILPNIEYKKVFLEDPLMKVYTAYATKIAMGRGKTSKYRGKGLKYYLELRFITKWFKVGKKLNYTAELFLNNEIDVDVTSAMLEDLPYKDGMMDLVVCNNVVDHVQDLDKCMAEMYRVLKPGGYLVFGNDLRNEDDLKIKEVAEDIGHPIHIDLSYLEEVEKKYNYKPVFRKVLSREESRYPAHYYSAYLGILQK